jgi:tRNA threonylcarbamoyladenosine biosynthesis protein TsaE
MQRFEFSASDEAATARLGRALAAVLPETATIALHGTLGAGKTRLVQALAAGCGVDPTSVTSPTFVLCQIYHGSRTLYHLDAYRVHDLDEFLELGVDEYFDGPGVTCIEWADRVAACLPEDRLEVDIAITGEEARTVTCTSHGPTSDALVQALKSQLSDRRS